MERARIVVVTGLPRSGTSLMMSMLAAGGVELVTDGARGPDLDNPRGYFELGRVRSLAKESAWVGELARGKAIKVISALLAHLPRTERYDVLFMQRDLDEILESQARMLERRGFPREPDQAALRAELAAHLAEVLRWLHGDPAFRAHEVRHRALIDEPRAEIDRLARFLGSGLDRDAMRRCVDPSLHRVRSAQR